jgi:hypothetical protein
MFAAMFKAFAGFGQLTADKQLPLLPAARGSQGTSTNTHPGKTAKAAQLVNQPHPSGEKQLLEAKPLDSSAPENRQRVRVGATA